MIYLAFTTALLVVGFVSAYPDGAGDSACGSMVPKHHHHPSKDTSPFEVLVSKQSYQPDEQIQVTIRQKPGFTTTFKGFLLEARRADANRDQSEAIGTFTPVSGTKVKCEGKHGNGITHSNPDLKEGLTMLWTAPSTPQGHLEFRATFVSAFDLFWVDQRSPLVSDPTTPAITDPKEGKISGGKEKHKFSKEFLNSKDMEYEKNQEMLPLVRVVRQAEDGRAEIDVRGCGDTKGCFRYPASCMEPNCETLVTWRDRGNFIDFELSGATIGWVAVGFSDDTRMGGDSVIECVYKSDKVSMDIRHSYNVPGEKKNEDVGVSGITNGDGYTIKDGPVKRLRCKFTREKFVNNEKIFDLSKAYYMLMTMGETDKDGKKKMHLIDAGKAPKVSPFRVDLTSTVDINGQARYPLVKAHGCLMVIAWIMSAGLGIIMARYYKPMWPNNRICGERVWFAVHRFCMILVLFCVVAAFIIIFIEAGGYSQMRGLPAAAHPILGIIVTCLVVINPLLALCRCNPKHKFRPVFNWFHWFIGTIAFVLQTPTLFIGLNLHKAHVPSWLTWVVVAFLLFHVVIELMLEIHGCINSKKDKERREEWEMRKKNDPSHEVYDTEPNPVGTRFKTIIISLYVVVMLILGLIIVITIAVS